MDSFAIELIERILWFSPGNTFCLSSRVCKKWLNAKQNIERTSGHFWKSCCDLEIEKCIFDELNNCSNASFHDLTEDKAKQIYIKWFRGKRISDYNENEMDFTDNSFQLYENIKVLKLTGTLLISGHRSGRVLIIDYKNDVIIPTIQHLEPVNDLALIDIVGHGHYEIHKTANYPTTHPSYSSHHHIISISKDSTIKIFPIHNTTENPNSIFEISSFERNFLYVRVCNDIIAVSSRQGKDISLFRLSLPKTGRVQYDRAFQVQQIKIIFCADVCPTISQWRGLFTFSDLKIKSFCHESDVIACCDVALNLSTEVCNVHWKWHWAHECLTNDNTRMTIIKGFSFGDGLFFIITMENRVYFTSGSNTFELFAIHDRLMTYDKIRTISLFGSMIAYGTDNGLLFIEHFPSLKRLPYITHYKPLFKRKISDQPILNINITDDGFGPVVAAANRDKIFVFKWTPKVIEETNAVIKAIDIIQLDDSDEE